MDHCPDLEVGGYACFGIGRSTGAGGYYEQGIMLETMHYPSEIRGTTELALPEDEVSFTDQEMQIGLRPGTTFSKPTVPISVSSITTTTA